MGRTRLAACVVFALLIWTTLARLLRRADDGPPISPIRPDDASSAAAEQTSSPGVLRRMLSGHRTLISNSSSLLGTTIVTSLLGLAYWGAAARLFPEETVGFGSAAVSAMTLLGTFGMLGLGTLLIAELPRATRGGSLVMTALIVCFGASAALGAGFALVAGAIAPGAAPYVDGAGPAALFIVGVGLTAIGFVLDQALIGMLWGGMQLWRNVVFAAAKLAVLVAAAPFLDDRLGVGVLLAWISGTAVSLIVLVTVLARHVRIRHSPDWALIRTFGRTANAHNWLNIAFQAPRLALPVVVVGLISAEANAAFFAAWTIAALLYVVPTHLTTVLFALGSADREALGRETRFSLRASLALGIVAVPLVALAAGPTLSAFGPSYSSQAALPLQILALGYFPTVVKVHYVAVGRVTGRLVRAAAWLTAGAALEIGIAAAVCVLTSSLVTLSIALVVAMTLEAAITAAPVAAVVRAAGAPDGARRNLSYLSAAEK